VPTQLCLGNTTGGQSQLLACGANGTVWVVVHSGNGDYLYSRYWLNQGDNEVLAAYEPGPAANVYVVFQDVLTSGDGWYARWSFASN
jgi:hypothetical protein